MPKHRNLLIVLADGEHARFVRQGAHNAIHPDKTLGLADADKQSADPSSDRPAGGFDTGSSPHHALMPERDPHGLEKVKFAHYVARQLNEAAAAGRFDELVVVAPSHTLNGIREHLDTTTAAMVVGTLAKDLVKTPDHELWPHLKPCIPLAPRVA